MSPSRVFLALGLVLTFFGCAGRSSNPGETHTIASASSQLSTTDWPCFVARDEYEVWLANAGDRSKQMSIEDHNAIWLTEGDTVRILQRGEGDTLHVRLLNSVVGEPRRSCWVLSDGGYLFSN